VSAYASAQNNPDYRYMNPPDQINLGNPALNKFFNKLIFWSRTSRGRVFVAIPPTA
jgi:hypothetical protein